MKTIVWTCQMNTRRPTIDYREEYGVPEVYVDGKSWRYSRSKECYTLYDDAHTLRFRRSLFAKVPII